MNSGNQGGLVRLYKALIYSFQGISAAFRNEPAFRQEMFLSFILIPLGFWLGNTGVEKALLVSSIIFVMVIELVNSGIEAVVDRFGGELHELSGRAKDVGSAAVLLALVNVVVTWSLVLFV